METATRSSEEAPAFTIAADRDWLSTIRQFLRAAGIRALVWDVDGTLTHRHAPDFAPEVRASLARLPGPSSACDSERSNGGAAPRAACSADLWSQPAGTLSQRTPGKPQEAPAAEAVADAAASRP